MAEEKKKLPEEEAEKKPEASEPKPAEEKKEGPAKDEKSEEKATPPQFGAVYQSVKVLS